ncbi:MAG: hypothetical protein AB4352_15245 [Hormoscilla sp.]
MNNAHYFRKPKLKRRSHLAIAILPDADAAFAAYRLLQHHGMSPEYLALVGTEYNNPEWVGLFKPAQIALHQAYRLGIFTGISGLVITGTLAIAHQLGLIPLEDIDWWLFVPTVSLLLGFCGAAIGALIGFFGEGNTAGFYRHQLRQGRYLLMIEGPEKIVRLGKEVLSQYSTPRRF